MERIVLVESNREVNDSFQKLLGSLGYAVYTFVSPTDALEHMPAISPHAVFTGLVFDDMNGFELCSRLRHLPATCTSLIVALTGLHFPGIEDLVEGSGIRLLFSQADYAGDYRPDRRCAR